ncbi:GntR family transcriptional regulator [Rhodococcus sp. JVH1]|uniref:GntR family transcriptional regulator n=1 Tax=Rhodococcus sp. JVH1 TaxID=745408 RepID=UPI0002720E21|nr:GntR family transcriptional regulator [Rhodococcus sp. JVH1]EJI95861.1 transcriptional regulator, GntR family [Rhodococcus sp. JVH1]
MAKSTSTRSERVYNALRKDILAGRRRPGSKLPYLELNASYNASMGVVREALSKLAAEGLVETEPQLGFRVKSLSTQDLEHLTEARCSIETLVLRSSVKEGGVLWESQVVAAHHRLEHTPQMAIDDPDRVSEEWADAHAEFHFTLLSACPNPRLLAIAKSLWDAAELYRRWSVPLGHEHRDIPGEHRAVLDAVLAHDLDAAVAELTKHIQHTRDALLVHLIEENSADAAAP